MKTFSAKATLSLKAAESLFESRKSTREVMMGVLRVRSNKGESVKVGGFTLRSEHQPARGKLAKTK